MPIRPENRARYPKDWKTVIVPEIRARSGNRCECTGQCGVIHVPLVPDLGDPLYLSGRCEAFNGDIGYHGPRGGWHSWPAHELGEVMEVDRQTGIAYRCIKVVLTVMHLNHNPEDNGTPGNRPNLLHGCQGCHNRYDAPHRAAGIKARRKAMMAAGDLFKCEEVADVRDQNREQVHSH